MDRGIVHLVARPEEAQFIPKGYLLIRIEGKQYLLKDVRQCSNFVRYLGSGYLKLRKSRDRNLILSELVKKAPLMKFWLDEGKGEILRCTSTDFIEIPHEWVVNLITQELKAKEESFQLTIQKTKGFNGLFYFDFLLTERTFFIDREDGISYRIVGWNQNDAHKALEIRAGLLRFICANGLVSGEQHSGIWIPHKYPLEKVKGMVRRALERVFEEIEGGKHIKILKEAREIEIYEEPIKIIEALNLGSLRLREYVLERIKKEFEESRTLFALSQAISWVGSNVKVTLAQMRYLQSLAWKVLIPENFNALMERAEKGAFPEKRGLELAEV